MPTIEEMRPILKAVFTQSYPNMSERIASIDEKAQRLHPYTDYRDMIYDELTTNPDRTDDEIAHLIAMRYAFP